MRAVTLSAQKAGISRLRDKGGASPQTLYTLLNGYVTTAKTLRARPGRTKVATAQPGTVGLTAFNSQFYVFASTLFAQIDPDVTCVALPHPSNPARTLARIHFAQAFLGRLYVAAEFDNGEIFHYWVTNAAAWQASTVYGYLQQVQPTTSNGFYYEASNVSTVISWSSGVTIVVNDERQPKVYNGFKYRAITVTGTAPVNTSETEPVWPTVEGGTVVEYSYGGTLPSSTPPSPTPTYPPGVDFEYSPFPPGSERP